MPERGLGTPPPLMADALPLAPGTAAVGTSLAAARQDHVHPAQSVPVAATATPLANGTAAVGSSLAYAREDHRHPLQGNTVTLIGTYAISDPTLINLALTVKRYTFSVAGLAVGDNVFATVRGVPSNGSLQDVYVSATNTLNVGALIPVLSIASPVSIPITVYRIT